MKPAPPVMSARTVSLSLKSESEPTDESDTAPEATEAAALEALIHRRAAVHFQKPGGVNPERRFAADRAAKLECRRSGIPLCTAGNAQPETHVFAHLEVRECRDGVVLISPRVVIAVVQVVCGFEAVCRDAHVEVEAR